MIEKVKRLVFQAEKPIRGSGFQVFTDGTLTVFGSPSSNGLHLPARLQDWIILPQSKADKVQLVLAKFQPIASSPESKASSAPVTVSTEIYHNNYGVFIRPKKARLKEKSVWGLMKEGEKLRCTVEGRIDGKEQLKSTGFFEKAAKVALETDLPVTFDQLNFITCGGHQNAKFAIYRDEKNRVYIRSRGGMDTCGSIGLSDEIGRYIESWFEKEELFICSKNDAPSIIIPSKVQTRKARPDQRQKVINFPYYGPCQTVEVVLSNPNLRLNETTIRDFELKENLKGSGVNIEALKSDYRDEGTHNDVKYVADVKSLIERAFESNLNPTILSEVEITAKGKVTENTEGNAKCVDLVVITWGKNANDTSVFLVEIKTSTKHTAQTKEEIGEIRHLQNKLGEERIIPLVFINYDVKSQGGGRSIITKNFGESHDVILIGLNEFQELKKNPKSLLDRINDFRYKMMEVKQDSQNVLHPLTGKVVTKQLLEREAQEILLSLTENDDLNSNDFHYYCQLMGLPVDGLWSLLESRVNNPSISESPKNSLLEVKGFYKELPPVKKGLLDLHGDLCKHGTLPILEYEAQSSNNDDLKVLIENWAIIEKNIPSEVKIFGTVEANWQGKNFEEEVKRELESEGFEVAANVSISYRGRLFEIDLLAFKGEEMTAVSCKDRGDYKNIQRLSQRIKIAANTLELRKNLLNANNAFLYVRVKPEYTQKMNEKFSEKEWVENIRIKIKD